jgi:hypothetical protein
MDSRIVRKLELCRSFAEAAEIMLSVQRRHRITISDGAAIHAPHAEDRSASSLDDCMVAGSN